MDTITDPNPGIYMRIVPMEEVLEGTSNDCDYMGFDSVWDLLPEKISDSGYPGLKDSIQKYGLQEGFEPCYRNGYVSEGHHRIAVLVEMGAQWCPVNKRDRWDSAGVWKAPDGSTPGSCAHCPDCDRYDRW